MGGAGGFSCAALCFLKNIVGNKTGFNHQASFKRGKNSKLFVFLQFSSLKRLAVLTTVTAAQAGTLYLRVQC